MPLRGELRWSGDLRFSASSGAHEIVVDSENHLGPSPMRLVLMGIAGCMAIDVVSILQKGRHPLTALRVTVSADRQKRPPSRFTAVVLHFHLVGDMADEAVSRAISLSRDRYCSVWHSMRADIELTTAFTIGPDEPVRP